MEWMSALHISHYYHISHWVHHISSCFLDAFRNAFDTGMLSGDVEYAGLAAMLYCANIFQYGTLPLGEVERKVRASLSIIEGLGQKYILAILVIIRRAVLCLIGKLIDTSGSEPVLAGQEQVRNKVQSDYVAQNDNFSRLVVACIMGERSVAAEMAQRVANSSVKNMSAIIVTLQKFYGGLSAIWMAQETNKTK